MEEKLCPYCYKSINGNYGTVDEDLICPHPDCGKRIPKVYLQYQTKHVASIVKKIGSDDFKDYGYEVADYAKSDNAEGINTRAEHCDSDDENVKIILYEYLKDEYSTNTETVVLAIHRSNWDEGFRRSVSDIEHASSILLNIDISELRALYFNLGINRSPYEFKGWHPKDIGKFVREISDYLRRNQLTRKVAILFGNFQYLSRHPYVREDKKYQELIEITKDWTSDHIDRRRMTEANNTIRDLLTELGEERLINDADTMSDLKFFFYPSSEYRMISNSFWMMAILLWICTKID